MGPPLPPSCRRRKARQSITKHGIAAHHDQIYIYISRQSYHCLKLSFPAFSGAALYVCVDPDIPIDSLKLSYIHIYPLVLLGLLHRNTWWRASRMMRRGSPSSWSSYNALVIRNTSTVSVCMSVWFFPCVYLFNQYIQFIYVFISAYACRCIYFSLYLFLCNMCGLTLVNLWMYIYLRLDL